MTANKLHKESSKVKILLVDDSEIIRERLKLMLEQIPLSTIIGEAKDTSEAMKRLEDLNPDIMILDIKLPGENGIEFLRRIRLNRNFIKVIILTSYPYPQYRKKCFEIGADYFLSKSTEIEQLPEIVQKLFPGFSQSIEEPPYE